MEKIKIGIVGYGNIGKGAEQAIKNVSDMELVGIFTRRNPNSIETITKGVNIYSIDELDNMTNHIDVLLMCGGSTKDLPVQTPKYAEKFNVVDTYDNHKEITNHYKRVNKSSKQGGKVAIISVGWDPGLFSLNRMISSAILPNGKNYTFWGKGLSQGHSEVLRKIKGVKDARQYTIPIEDALNSVREGKNPRLKVEEQHKRECYLVLEEGYSKEEIKNEIINMPNYFKGYETNVNFISEEEMKLKHKGFRHGGFVIRSGKTGVKKDNSAIIEFNLDLESNPEFTSGVLLAYARAAYRMNKEGDSGCKTIFDVPPKYIAMESNEILRKKML